MSLRTEVISSLFNGVSQQPPTIRSHNQLEAVDNCYPTVSHGVMKRPPTEYVAKVSDESLEGAAVHTINRDVNERYIVILKNQSIVVYDLDGNEKIVNYPVGNSYLTSSKPTEDFSLITVADYTFIVNKSVTVAVKDDTNADLTLPPDTSLPFDGHTGFVRRVGVAMGAIDPDIREKYQNPTRGAYRGSVQHFNDLPEEPTEGEIYKVMGTAGSGSFTSYYVIRRNGLWEETVKPGIKNVLDDSTMPHALVRKEDGQFELVPFTWKPRRMGDTQSNPDPTFVGRSIRDVFFYRNRLGFLSDESIIFSAASDFGNFYRSTVLDIIDSDVIDNAVTTNSVSILNHALPFNKGMVIMSDQTQFAFTIKDLLTPSTVAVDPVTNYEVSQHCRPVGIGNDAYFVSEKGDYATIYEYFVDNDEVQTDAADVTSHVPRYIPTGVFKLAASANKNILVALTEGEQNSLFVYNLYWLGEEKAQSAWHKWSFNNAKILNVEILDDKLLLVLVRNGKTYLETINLGFDTTETGLPFNVFLDSRIKTTGVYVQSLNKTSFQLPYSTSLDHVQVVRDGTGTTDKGTLVDPAEYQLNTEGDVLTITGDYSSRNVYIGDSYTQSFTLSEQFTKDRNNRAITTGRLQLRTVTIYFEDTGYFSTSVAPYGLDATEEDIAPAHLADFTGKQLGSAALRLNQPILSSGAYSFGIYGESKQAVITIKNKTHVPSRFLSAEWEGLYFKRN